MIHTNKPIVGYLFAAPLGGKDTSQEELIKIRPDIAVIHMSTLLQVVICKNATYQKLVQEGGLLPPEEAVRAFRRGFLEITKGLDKKNLPHILANGANREEYEVKSNHAMIRRVRQDSYQEVGFRFILDKQHIKSRAEKRVQDAIAIGKKPRPDDLGNTPFERYRIFDQNLSPVLEAFEKSGGTVVPIDANGTPEEVASQIVAVYDRVVLPERLVA